MKKIKILAIDQGEHLGGAERFFAEMLSYLSERFEIHLLTEMNPEYHELYKNSDVALYQVSLPKLKPISWKNYGRFRTSQEEISKYIDELQPDIMISNTVRTHLLVSPLASSHKIPLVWMAHDLTFPSSLLWWYRRYPRVVIACSEFVRHYYRGFSKLPDIEVVYPFVIEEGVVERLKKSEKRKVIGMVGKFISWKGQDTFIQMAKDIHQRHPDYRFVIVGSPYAGSVESERYFEHCRQLIQDNGLREVLTIMPTVPDILSEAAGWEILVHCSKQPEPLGRVVLEGMAAGCAVVASNLGGPREIVDDQKTGLLVHPDHQHLTATVQHLIEDPKLMRTLSENGRKEAEQKYSPKMTLGKVEEILQRL